jgi:hypothetical protein
MLTGIFEVYGRPAPSAEAQAVWWRILRNYALADVSQAFGVYTRTEPKFPPTPAQVLALLGEGQGDNRPTADEAWAIALGACDEADTVVWTEETAQAFDAARPVLDLGDKVGARMAFKGAYERLVEAARRDGKPMTVRVSLGWDGERRVAAINAAVTSGLLPVPQAAAFLPAPDGGDRVDANVAAQIDGLRRALDQKRDGPTAADRASTRERSRHAQLLAEHDAKLARLLDGEGFAA